MTLAHLNAHGTITPHTHTELSPSIVLYLLQKFLLTFFGDCSIGVAHHGNQHVKKQDGHNNHEDDEEDPRHRFVIGLLEVAVLLIRAKQIVLNTCLGLALVIPTL